MFKAKQRQRQGHGHGHGQGRGQGHGQDRSRVCGHRNKERMMTEQLMIRWNWNRSGVIFFFARD